MKDQQKKDWESILEDYKSSGLTCREYASLNNLNISALYYHLRKRRTETEEKKTSEFIEIPLSHGGSDFGKPEITMSMKHDTFTIQIRFGV